MSTPILDLARVAQMSPRATAALKAAGIETAEEAAAKSDEELVAIPGFKGESLGRLREWQRAQSAKADPVEPLAEKLLLEMVKVSNNPGPGLAGTAWQTAARFHEEGAKRKEAKHGE